MGDPSVSARAADDEPGAAARGLSATVAAFLMWGLFPLYLRPLRHLPAHHVMGHRVVWCCLLVLGWLAARGGLGELRRALATPTTRRALIASALLVSANWLGFVWAVGSGRVLEASLGYFINPLVNVVLGVTVLSERLTRRQWACVALAALGVLWLALAAAEPPWLALGLAFSFGGYGLIRKLVAVDAVVGLAAETSLLAPFALLFLLFIEVDGQGAFSTGDAQTIALLVGSGLATAVPLSLFAFGARRIPYSTVGLIQYLGPTLQFICGRVFFGEPFGRERLIGFGLIWISLVLYAREGLSQAGAAARRSAVGSERQAR